VALVLADRVQQTGTANTTVSFTLSGSVTGFQSFSVIGNGNTTYYSAFDPSGNWEVGVGTYATGGTLTRTTIVSSSNSGSAVTFSGQVNVFVTQPSGNTVVSSNNPGTSGYALVSNGTGVAPTWQPSGGSNTFSGFYLSADRSVLYVDYSDTTPATIDTANYLTWTAAINTTYSVTNNNLNMLL
jgi:dipeptidyl aminopeptidase/acylaminoacyl peptidase